MKAIRCGLAGLLMTAGVMGLAGCGSGNPNETEFLRTAPPGKPPDDPEDQKVAHRRERTKIVPKQIQDFEARNQAAAKKKAAKP